MIKQRWKWTLMLAAAVLCFAACAMAQAMDTAIETWDAGAAASGSTGKETPGANIQAALYQNPDGSTYTLSFSGSGAMYNFGWNPIAKDIPTKNYGILPPTPPKSPALSLSRETASPPLAPAPSTA